MVLPLLLDSPLEFKRIDNIKFNTIIITFMDQNNKQILNIHASILKIEKGRNNLFDNQFCPF